MLKKNIFGISMCIIMVLIMSFLNIYINCGSLKNAVVHAVTLFPLTFIIAFSFEKFIVNNFKILLTASFFSNKNIIKNELFNTIFIVVFMSLFMTFIGEIIGGIIVSPLTFMKIWPRNLLIAFLVNIFIAIPISKTAQKIVKTK